MPSTDSWPASRKAGRGPIRLDVRDGGYFHAGDAGHLGDKAPAHLAPRRRARPGSACRRAPALPTSL